MKRARQHRPARDPGHYTNSAYPLQYYFEVTQSDATSLYPGFDLK
jgi:hypothetical protein